MADADDEAVSAVLGTVLMLALMATMIPGVMLLHAAVTDQFAAQREAAERAAYCARHPSVGPPTCDAKGPLPGYACREVEADAWVCAREEAKTTALLERLERETVEVNTSEAPIAPSLLP